MGYHTIGGKNYGVPNKSGLHVQKCELKRNASGRRICRTRCLRKIPEEHDHITESDPKAQLCFRCNEGELPTARRVHKEHKAGRQDERKGQGLSSVRSCRSGITTDRRSRMCNAHTAFRLNTKRQNRGSSPLLSRNPFSSRYKTFISTNGLYFKSVQLRIEERKG